MTSFPCSFLKYNEWIESLNFPIKNLTKFSRVIRLKVFVNVIPLFFLVFPLHFHKDFGCAFSLLFKFLKIMIRTLSVLCFGPFLQFILASFYQGCFFLFSKTSSVQLCPRFSNHFIPLTWVEGFNILPISLD